MLKLNKSLSSHELLKDLGYSTDSRSSSESSDSRNSSSSSEYFSADEEEDKHSGGRINKTKFKKQNKKNKTKRKKI